MKRGKLTWQDEEKTFSSERTADGKDATKRGRDPTGRIRYGYCYGKTYKETKQKVCSAKLEIMTGLFAEKARTAEHFGTCCDAWLRAQAQHDKPSTIAKYSIILEKHIKPALGGVRLSMLDNEVCECFRMRLAEELSPKSVKDVLVVLRSIFKFVSASIPSFGKNVSIVFPKCEKKEMRVLSLEEQGIIIEYLNENLDPCCFGILLAVSTGLRIGEICALKWRDISTREGTVKVHATMQRLKNFDAGSGAKTKVVTGTPKSDKSTRTVPLTCGTSELCRRMDPGDPDAYILTGNRKFMEPRALQYRFKKIAENCGLNDVHFHTLRHTFATRCVEVGFEIKSLSEILGHSNTTITLDRYVHSSMKLKRENMEKLSALGF